VCVCFPFFFAPYHITISHTFSHSHILPPAFGFEKRKSGCLTYWHRNPSHADGDGGPPIVFCHGLGIGVLSYVTVIREVKG
jgi:hypothetical protein